MIKHALREATIKQAEAKARAETLEGVLADVLRIIRADQQDKEDAIGQLADKLLAQHANALQTGGHAAAMLAELRAVAEQHAEQARAEAEAAAEEPEDAAAEG